MYGQNDFLHSTVNEVASMAAILVQKLCVFFFVFFQNEEKWSQVTKNACFALNHLIYIFSIYIILYIYNIHDNHFSAIADGTSYSAWAKVTVGG